MYREQLKASLNRISEIPAEEFEYYANLLEWRSVEKGEWLLRSGEVCTEIYFCAKGVFRIFYTTHDGAEFNKSLLVENNFFTSYSSLIMQIPSGNSVEALEPSTIGVITKDNLEHLYTHHRCWETLGRKLAEGLYVKKELRERQLLLNSAEERYALFQQEFPGLEHRIPQYHIASYIGITPVSLSRIKGSCTINNSK